jgi:hypothetical protein
MRTDDTIQETVTTVSTCYLCYFVAESGGAGVSGVSLCVSLCVSSCVFCCVCLLVRVSNEKEKSVAHKRHQLLSLPACQKDSGESDVRVRACVCMLRTPFFTGVSGVYMCVWHQRQRGVRCPCACVRVHVRVNDVNLFIYVNIFISSCARMHARARRARAHAHTHRSSVGAHGRYSYCGVRTHSDSHGAGRTHAARGMYVYTYICTHIP